MDSNNKWLVVVNPHAATGKGGRDWSVIKKILMDEGFIFDARLTEYQRHAIDIAQKGVVEEGYRKIISIGGDGTNNEVINGIFSQNVVPPSGIKVGVIPVGTGNDWTRMFGFPSDYREIAKIIKSEYTFLHDIGKVTYYNDGNPKVRYFLNSSGAGLDSAVCQEVNQLKAEGKGGKIHYLLCLIKGLRKHKYCRVKIEVEGREVFNEPILSLSVGNCCFNGGGMKMLPRAIPNDGLLDITVVSKVSVFKFFTNATNLYDGTFVDKMKEVKYFQGNKMRITSDPPHLLMIETEGETLTNSPFDFEVLPKAINMIIPSPPIREGTAGGGV